MEFGWGLPFKLNGTGRLTTMFKPKQEWDKLEIEGSEVNAKISLDEFSKIVTCKHAIEAWDILSITHEDTSIMKCPNFKYSQPSLRAFGCNRMRLSLHSILN